MENCVIYARFSSHGQNEQSIEAQVRICTETAEKQGLNVVKVYSDKARTGTNDDRPAFQRMINDAASGTFKYIVVYMFDRFARNRRDSIMYKEMLKERFGIKVVSALEPVAEGEGGEIYEMLLDWEAEKYSKRLSKRVRDGLDTSVANGTFCGGYLIYGYKLRLEPTSKPNHFIKYVEIDEDEAEILRYVFEQYDKGVTKKEIAQALNEKGLRFRGKPFQAKTFDRYICNPKYTGEFSFGTRECNNMYPQIIDKALFFRVQERLSKNRYFLGGTEKSREPYLLTYKLFCGKCFKAMVADGGTSKSGKEMHYYSCKGKKKHLCDKRTESKDRIELMVAERTKEYFSDPDNLRLAAENAVAHFESRAVEESLISIRNRIAAIEKEADRQTEAFINATSTLLRKKIEDKMREYEILLADLQKQEARLEIEAGCRPSVQSISDFISELIIGDPNDKAYQKRVIDHLVEFVLLNDNGFSIVYTVGNSCNTDFDKEALKKEIADSLLSDIKDYENTDKGVQMLSPPSRQKQAKSNPRFSLFFIRG